MNLKKIYTLSLFSIMIFSFLVSCSSDTNSTTDSQSELSVDVYQIALITKMVDSPYWQTVKTAAEEKASELGNVVVTHLGPTVESDINSQISIVETCISGGYDGIILAACDIDALIEPVKKAKASGIPVVMIDSGLSEPVYDAFLSTDNVASGRECAKLMAQLIGGVGQVGIVNFSAGSSTAIDRETGFRAELEENFPELEIVAVQYCDSDSTVASNQATDMLNAFENLSGIWGANDQAAIGVANAVRNSDHNQVVVIGFDNSADIIAGLEEGIIQGTAVQMPTTMGSSGVSLVMDLIQGIEIIEKEIDTGVYMVSGENLYEDSSQQALHQ